MKQKFELTPAQEFIALVLVFFLVGFGVKECEACEYPFGEPTAEERKRAFDKSIEEECAKKWFLCIDD